MIAFLSISFIFVNYATSASWALCTGTVAIFGLDMEIASDSKPQVSTTVDFFIANVV